mgnify:FL=1
MSFSRAPRDRGDDGLLTLIGDLPELVRNLVVAEIDAAKAWVRRSAKDAGIGSGWMAAALFCLFWTLPTIGLTLMFVLAIWLPLWASALIMVGIGILATAVFALLGILRFKQPTRSENPVQAAQRDLGILKGDGDEF